MQRASAKVVAQGASVLQEVKQRAVPAARNAWQRALDRNAAFVRKEPPGVVAKELMFTTMARCARFLPRATQTCLDSTQV